MKRVWKQFERRRTDIAKHAFFDWLSSDDVPLEDRFIFSPVMIDFIMGFADMNKWFLSYPDARSNHEHAINEHTAEDRTHSRFFYEDWYTLELGDTSQWKPGKMLWWMFHSRDTANVRRFGMKILKLAVTLPDPLVRFSMMEAIEICGDVFFSNTAPVARRLSERDGTPHRYYGDYHLERETGHLHTDESAFLEAVLDSQQLDDARYAVDVIFDNFVHVLDEILSYARRACADSRALSRDIELEYRIAMQHASRSARRPTPPPPDVSPSQREISDLLEQRRARLARHPFLEWLRSDTDVEPREKLQHFVALWGVDIAGYKDFNEFVLQYPDPSSRLERAINRWSSCLATHGASYLQDWRALDMDRVLQWDSGETVAFYFLGEQTEIHRHNMAKVKAQAFGHDDPLLRFWLMYALEQSGVPLFATTRELAETVERTHAVTLDYWADRHWLAHASRDDGEPPRDVFLPLEIDAPRAEIARNMIELIFDNMEQQYSLSLSCAQAGLCVRAARTLPPTRVSYFSGEAADDPAAWNTQKLA